MSGMKSDSILKPRITYVRSRTILDRLISGPQRRPVSKTIGFEVDRNIGRTWPLYRLLKSCERILTVSAFGCALTCYILRDLISSPVTPIKTAI